MILRILGSAAGGGVPQWNCNCTNCAAARAGDQPRRTQSCAAVSADGASWVLLNCSPDIASQIESNAALQPREIRGTPIAGMLLTDANVDHIGGLATLRQSGAHRFIVRSSQTVREIATAQPAFAPCARPPHRWVDVPFGTTCEPLDDDDPVGTTLQVRALPVPGTTPGFDGRRNVRGAVVAYEISEVSNDRTLLFAPVFSAIDEPLFNAIARAAVAILDGSFYSDDEMIEGGLMRKRARDLGHLPVGGAGGTLEKLRGLRTRAIFSHLNNSNPMLEKNSAAANDVCAAGFELAYDGMELRL
jgi:pyrroloquinoline quinone biosynthesis protein B